MPHPTRNEDLLRAAEIIRASAEESVQRSHSDANIRRADELHYLAARLEADATPGAQRSDHYPPAVV